MSPRFRSKITGEEVTRNELVKELCQEMKREALKTLDARKEKVLASHPGRNVRIKTKVVTGYPVEEIIKYAKDQDADLIVIGNVGLSGVSRLKALGSVSRGVSERAACPVMIVH